MKTPKADKILQTFHFETKEGHIFNDTITQGQREIMEIILNRGFKGAEDVMCNRIHVMAHTRYGKSLAVGAAVAVRASMKKEKWAIIAPTKEQAQIIMDYVITFSVNDPIISALLKTNAKQIKNETLTQRRSRNHITYLNQGEVRTFYQGNTMGFGSENVILDESGLINNNEYSKVFRMLGDNPDNFLMKIGNPWDSIDQESGTEHHFYQSYQDPKYHQIDIQIDQGIAEGRVTEEYHEEVKNKANYAILYKNTFPNTERRDKEGYMPLLGHATIQKAMVEPDTLDMLGEELLGADPADGGENESTIARRGMNLAKIVFRSTATDCLDFADDIVTNGDGINNWFVDGQGVGSGTCRKLEKQSEYYRKLNRINAGDSGKSWREKLPKDHHAEQYLNLRAYIFWQMKLWIENGGKIEKTPGIEKQLLALKYKNSRTGKVQIIDKQTLHKRGIHDLGLVDPISFTFAPKTKKLVLENQQVAGGVEPYYPELGF